MLFRYMIKELRNSPRFALLFVLNMSLGLLGFISLDALKRTFDDTLQSSARTLLGADLAISGRRTITDAELDPALKTLPSGSRAQKVVSLYTMASSKGQTSLVELKAIEDGFPFYGDLTLDPYGPHRAAPSLQSHNVVWLAPELALKLGVKIGDDIKIGQASFQVAALIKDDMASLGASASMAPHIYMGFERLAETKLLAAGNTASQAVLIQTPPDTDLKSIAHDLRTALPDNSLRIRTYQESGQDNGRMLGYLADYLGLVALVAFSLAGIGATYLYRDFFHQRTTSIAVLMSLGLSHSRALLLYVAQIAVLGLLSSALSLLLAKGALPLLLQTVKDFSPVAISSQIPVSTAVFAILLGSVGSVILCLPLLERLRQLNPAYLFHEQSSAAETSLWRETLATLPLIAAFYGLSLWQAHSVRVGSVFFGVAMVVLLLFIALAWLFMALARLFRRSPMLPVRLASTFLRAHPAATVSAFIALGLSGTLINLIPQLQASLLKELQRPDGQSLPSFFLFDIQDDQVDPLNNLLRSLGASPQTVSPMITARFTKINDAPLQRGDDESNETREAQEAQSTRNRGVNLSYRDHLARGESLDEGRFFTSPYSGQGLGEVSIETNYARRLGIKLGDKMTFDVQGLAIDARVTSFRKVKWNTFEPNFFLVLQPGVIDDAPKTFLMNIPELPLAKKVDLQLQVVKAFPNVSVIDVSALIAKISTIISQMALVLNVMAYLTSLTGLLVIYSIAEHQALSRRWDHNLLKILGAEFSTLFKATLCEFAGIAGVASLFGAAVGVVSSLVIAKFLFKGVWQPHLGLPFLLGLGLTLFCITIAGLATYRILKSKPELAIES